MSDRCSSCLEFWVCCPCCSTGFCPSCGAEELEQEEAEEDDEE